MKEWILRYAEQSDDQSSEDDESNDTRKSNPELEEKFDPVSHDDAVLLHYVLVPSAVFEFTCSPCRTTDIWCWPHSCMMLKRWQHNLKPRKTKQDRGQHKTASESSSKVSIPSSSLLIICNHCFCISLFAKHNYYFHFLFVTRWTKVWCPYLITGLTILLISVSTNLATAYCDILQNCVLLCSFFSIPTWTLGTKQD